MIVIIYLRTAITHLVFNLTSKFYRRCLNILLHFKFVLIPDKKNLLFLAMEAILDEEWDIILKVDQPKITSAQFGLIVSEKKILMWFNCICFLLVNIYAKQMWYWHKRGNKSKEKIQSLTLKLRCFIDILHLTVHWEVRFMVFVNVIWFLVKSCVVHFLTINRSGFFITWI